MQAVSSMCILVHAVRKAVVQLLEPITEPIRLLIIYRAIYIFGFNSAYLWQIGSSMAVSSLLPPENSVDYYVWRLVETHSPV